MNRIVKINQDYYEGLYRHKCPIMHLLHARASFDQQSKSRANHAVADVIVRRMLRERGRVRVLDYGSGWGAFLLNLPRSGVEAYCFDISTKAVLYLQSAMRFLGRSVDVIHVGEEGDMHPGDFDLIVCSHVLEHVESDRVLLGRLVRALRPAGHVLVNVPINESWNDPKHVRSYTPEALRRLMISAGLRIVTSWQGDKWTDYLLQHEKAGRQRLFVQLALRVLRASLALLPHPLVQWGERVLVRSYREQQLVMLGAKQHEGTHG